ncbi:MAG: MBL fold metallo-hydrolase [Bryobacterales bacterium]|nr:MBL fold metallo-hydrolase [Bryobacterales bacterium]MBV9400694.1 MBL fold metallo-hydrolase [Bryobacterales bacterium]
MTGKTVRGLDRREVIKTALAVFTTWACPRLLNAQQTTGRVRRLTDKLAVIDGGGANVLAFSSDNGLILVDSGAPKSADQVMAALKDFAPGAKVQTLFNTHYHLDQTANNEVFAAAGVKIVAHERTREWMATDYWAPAEERYEKARPKAARPTETFQTTGSLKAGSEQIDYGYLLLAHTSGDIYVKFKNSNVIAVGDAASPQRDPSLDWFTGAWIGGRVDAMDAVLKLSNDQTKIVPAYGPVMTRAEFKAERDIMEEVRARLFKQVREGDGPKDMLEEGVLNGLPRTWKDPYKFLYDAAKGLWAHHDKLDPNVV